MNFLAAHRLDRATDRRLDAQWLSERLHHPDTRIVPVWRLRNLVQGGERLRPVFLTSRELGIRDTSRVVLLGVWERTTFFAWDVEGEGEAIAPSGAAFEELRDVGVRLDPQDGALLAYARALVYWNARHQFCGECGRRTRSCEGGHMRVCTDAACGARQFPRTDPAVIVLVLSPGDSGTTQRCLLGRPSGWPARLYSTVAGFVEPGESVEDAVVREVAEETGIEVQEVHYHSSQPWPFPSSLMLGFVARAASGRIVLRDDELEDARWFSRAEIVDQVMSGALRLPRRVSIAYRLVEDWFDAGDAGSLQDLLYAVAGTSR